VRYTYGPESQREAEQLILMIYAPHESSAMLFDIGLTDNQILIGAPTNFKESAGRLQMEETSDAAFR
jgi:hypothetical protein